MSINTDLSDIISACRVYGFANRQKVIIEALQYYRRKTFDYIHKDHLKEPDAVKRAYEDVNYYLDLKRKAEGVV